MRVIIWKGWGILVVVIVGVSIGIFGSLFAVFSEDEFPPLGAALGFAVAAVVIYLLGQRLNAPHPGYHPKTGEPVTYRNGHNLFFIPMQYWAFVSLGVSLLLVVLAATGQL